MANSLSAAIKATVRELEMIKQDLIISHQVTMYEIGEQLVYQTPLKTGLASNNWNVTADDTTEPEREAGFEGGKGLSSLNAISYQVKDLYKKPESLFYNPVDYIWDLEAGSSRQAPNGIVTPTVPQVENIWIDNLQKNGIIK